MTCPDRPHDLDLLLVGEPVAESVREHAATCEACADEVALDALLTERLRARRSVTAPPDLIAAALAEAKGESVPAGRPARRALAASRPAVRSAQPRTLRVAALALLAALAVVTVWALRPTDAPGVMTPLTAEAPETAPPAEVSPVPDTVPPDSQTTDETEVEAPEPDLGPTPPAAAPQRQPVQRRRATPAPRRTPSPAPDLEEAPDSNIAQNDRQPDEAEPSPEEVARAEAELKLAFSLVGQHARQAVTTSADAISPTLDHALPFSP